MSVSVAALASVFLLLGMTACIVLGRKRVKPVFRTLAVILGVLAGLCMLYCAAALLLVAGIR